MGCPWYRTVGPGSQTWNDLSDPAVNLPGWTAYPLAFGAACLVLGLVLRIGAAHNSKSSP